jgi:hypothetical protein
MYKLGVCCLPFMLASREMSWTTMHSKYRSKAIYARECATQLQHAKTPDIQKKLKKFKHSVYDTHRSQIGKRTSITNPENRTQNLL